VTDEDEQRRGQIAALAAEYQRRVDDAERVRQETAARGQRAAADTRNRRLELLRSRGVDDPEQVLARLEREADVEAERDRAALELAAAQEQMSIRVPLDQQVRTLELLEAGTARDEAIAAARSEAEVELAASAMKVGIELEARRWKLLEAKLRSA